jgi:hypothetical protein
MTIVAIVQSLLNVFFFLVIDTYVTFYCPIHEF